MQKILAAFFVLTAGIAIAQDEEKAQPTGNEKTEETGSTEDKAEGEKPAPKKAKKAAKKAAAKEEPAAKDGEPAAAADAAKAEPAAEAAPATEAAAGDQVESESAAKEDAASSKAKASGVPDPKTWLEELIDQRALQKGGSYPGQILVIKKIADDKEPEVAEIDSSKFGEFGYLRITPADDIELFFKLNKKPDNLKESKKKLATKANDWLELLFEVSGADTVLTVENPDIWQIYRRENGKPKEILSKAAPKNAKAEELHKWLLASLGYEGVVMDKRGDYLLVGTLENLKKDDAQALILRDTSDKFSLEEKDKKGAGLMQLVSKHRGVGVFQMLVVDKAMKDIPIGTKIVIEREAKKKK